jgi:phosphoribosyl 1,2-cyclic phosphate phosphodiesterase
MSLDLIFLGTGTSAGVPMIGCTCPVCTSADPRDRRDRPSVLVRYGDASKDDASGGGGGRDASGGGSGGGGDASGGHQFLIDTTPDLRHQAIRNHIHRIDGVFYTHAHADHIFGLDDLRRFNAVMKQPIPIYAERSVLDHFFTMFPYIFQAHKNVNATFVAQLIPTALAVGEPVLHFDARWTPLRLMHGRLPILGFRIDHGGAALAYCTDVSTIPPETFPLLQGLDVLVLDALRYRHHPTHLTVDRALEIVAQLKPRRAYFTHIAHEIRHAELAPKLPEGVALAFDNLALSIAPGVVVERSTPTTSPESRQADPVP